MTENKTLIVLPAFEVREGTYLIFELKLQYSIPTGRSTRMSIFRRRRRRCTGSSNQVSSRYFVRKLFRLFSSPSVYLAADQHTCPGCHRPSNYATWFSPETNSSYEVEYEKYVTLR